VATEPRELVVRDYDLAPVGDEPVTVSTDAVDLDPPDLADLAQVQVQDQPVRMRVAGAAPTASSGISWAAGEMFELAGLDTIRGALFIREGAADATLFVTYYARRRPRAGSLGPAYEEH
jgi:hypothetical protein